MNIWSAVYFIIAVLSLVTLFVFWVTISLKTNKMQNEVDTLLVEKEALLRKLNYMINNSDNANIEQTEGFLKFISESRDWAFKYIEEVQEAITEFQRVAPNYVTLGDSDEYNKACKRLIDLLPQDK